MALSLAQDPAADAVLSSEPFVLLVGMLLDQQVPMERAFGGRPGCTTGSASTVASTRARWPASIPGG